MEDIFRPLPEVDRTLDLERNQPLAKEGFWPNRISRCLLQVTIVALFTIPEEHIMMLMGSLKYSSGFWAVGSTCTVWIFDIIVSLNMVWSRTLILRRKKRCWTFYYDSRSLSPLTPLCSVLPKKATRTSPYYQTIGTAYEKSWNLSNAPLYRKHIESAFIIVSSILKHHKNYRQRSNSNITRL